MGRSDGCQHPGLSALDRGCLPGLTQAWHSPAPDGTFVHNLTKTQGSSVISVTPMVMRPCGPAETVNNGCPRKDVGLSPTS